jgi:divalent metal cation (Fe/Co/Zn/Cd) transporter
VAALQGVSESVSPDRDPLVRWGIRLNYLTIGYKKRNVAVGLASGTLAADAAQTSLCAYLSAIALAGVGINALLGWWWTDPVAAIAMLPIIVKEGVDGVRGRSSCTDGCKL